MERNIRMAKLYFHMAENQFILGIIDKADHFLKQSDICSKKALKIDE